MAWTSNAAKTAAKTAAKYGVKYGPHAVAVWKVAGHHVESAARQKVDEVAARRTAFDHADSVDRGSVLRVVDRGRAVFVVFSAEDPVASYPEGERSLTELTERADLAKRVTSEEHRQRRLRARARRAGTQALGR
jgi:hypothetical protein